MRNALLVVGIGALIVGAGWYFAQSSLSAKKAPSAESKVQPQQQVSLQPEQPTQGASIGEENLVEFRCDSAKRITAVFARDIVGLTLSDGRQIELREAVSGSDISYHSNDQKIEFRAKGEGGMLIENGKTTFANCVAML